MFNELIEWLVGLVGKLFTEVWDFFYDIFVYILEALLGSFATVFESIPAPAFLSSYSLGNLFSALPSDLLYFIAFFNLPVAFSILLAGFSFRMLRKVSTLFQW